jgi:hypothetical protein
MVILPLNSVAISYPGKRRIILDLSYPKNGNGVNNFVCKDCYLREKVDIVFPKIDDLTALIQA